VLSGQLLLLLLLVNHGIGSLLETSFSGAFYAKVSSSLDCYCLQQEAVQTSRSAGCLTPINDKKAGRQCYPQFQSVEESNALRNWKANMAVRKRQQNYLSREPILNQL